MDQALYSAYVKILEEELVPAMGCTEPIAVAYAAALARKALGEMPQSVEVHVSANIIKNVKSVVVPHTGGLRGIGREPMTQILPLLPTSHRDCASPASTSGVADSISLRISHRSA